MRVIRRALPLDLGLLPLNRRIIFLKGDASPKPSLDLVRSSSHLGQLAGEATSHDKSSPSVVNPLPQRQ